MPGALHVNAITAHAQPLAPGPGSTAVFIDNQPAWRALPAGVGDGLEKATQDIKELMDSPQLTPPDTTPKLVKIQASYTESAAQSAAKCDNPAAASGVTTAFTTLQTTNIQLTATWAATQPTPGAAAGTLAYTMAIKAALSAASSAAVTAIAGTMDMSVCGMPGAVPHGPGLVTQGSTTVFIDGLPAAHQGHKLFEAGAGPVEIQMASQTVFIDD